MKWLIFAVLLGVAFVVTSGSNLPEMTASHFGDDGFANDFMSRGSYIAVMAGLTGVIPLIVAGSFLLAVKMFPSGINLPNREHWLAPERQAQTLSWLSSYMQLFAGALVILLCFMHWLVVQANASQPPRMAQSFFMTGLTVFFVFLCVWLTWLVLRFRRIPTL